MNLLRKIIRPVAFVTFVAMVLNIGRLGLNEHIPYIWLNWNVFLALLPLLFAYLFIRTKQVWQQFLWFLLWLGFLPNAPYIVTDFIHLANVGPKSILWYDAIMILMYAIAGIVVWVATTRVIRSYMHWNQWFTVLVGILSGFGVYLGRYIRLNTWDLVTEPMTSWTIIGKSLLFPMQHQPLLLMVLVFTLLLVVTDFIWPTATKK